MKELMHLGFFMKANDMESSYTSYGAIIIRSEKTITPDLNFLAIPIPLITNPILGVYCRRLQQLQHLYGFASFIIMFLNETFELSSCACSPI